jgi:hypothetical protein
MNFYVCQLFIYKHDKHLGVCQPECLFKAIGFMAAFNNLQSGTKNLDTANLEMELDFIAGETCISGSCQEIEGW